jgi:TIR domain
MEGAAKVVSIQSLFSDIARCHKEIASLEAQRARYSKDRADALGRANTAQKSITGSASPSTIQSKQRDIQRYQDDAVRASDREADIARKIANESNKLSRYQEQLQREQITETRKLEDASKRLEDSLKRRQDEMERVQRSAVREIHRGMAVAVPVFRSGLDASVLVSHDAFISHASEDKDDIVRALAMALSERGFSIWYDEFQLKVGDSLRRSIDRGLRDSRFGIVVLSEAFFSKNWPQYELDGLVAREMNGGKVIPPIWHKVAKDQVMGYSPSLADKLALNTSTMTLAEVVDALADVIQEVKHA